MTFGEQSLEEMCYDFLFAYPRPIFENFRYCAWLLRAACFAALRFIHRFVCACVCVCLCFCVCRRSVQRRCVGVRARRDRRRGILRASEPGSGRHDLGAGRVYGNGCAEQLLCCGVRRQVAHWRRVGSASHVCRSSAPTPAPLTCDASMRWSGSTVLSSAGVCAAMPCDAMPCDAMHLLDR